jgi:hypothetical protein
VPTFNATDPAWCRLEAEPDEMVNEPDSNPDDKPLLIDTSPLDPQLDDAEPTATDPAIPLAMPTLPAE